MATPTTIEVGLLADHPEAIPKIVAWFEREWPEWYGPEGPGTASADVHASAGRDALPIGLIAWSGGVLCGILVLKADSIDTHPHLGPWAAAGLVLPAYRRQGIGARLLEELESLARRLGYPAMYAGTSTAMSLLDRAGWECVERLPYHGEDLRIYKRVFPNDSLNTG